MNTLNRTSTFTIDHDRCKPERWTAQDILAISEFCKNGGMEHAAEMERLGMTLVTSEHHTPKGGSLEHLGWVIPAEPSEIIADLDEAMDNADAGDLEIVQLHRVYVGQAEYAVRIPVDDDRYETEIKATKADAEAYIRAMKSGL